MIMIKSKYNNIGLGLPLLNIMSIAWKIDQKQGEKLDKEWQAEYDADKASIVKIGGYNVWRNNQGIYTIITPEVDKWRHGKELPFVYEYHGRADLHNALEKSGILRPYQFYLDINTKQATPVYPDEFARVFLGGSSYNSSGNYVTTGGGNYVTTQQAATQNKSKKKKYIALAVLGIAAVGMFLILKD